MSRRKKLDLLLNLAWYAALGGIAAVCLQILLPRLAPLLLGLGLAVALHPAALWLCRHLHLPGRTAALAATLLAFGLTAALLWGLGLLVWVQCGKLLRQMPTLWQRDLLPFFQGLSGVFSGLAERFLPGSGQFFAQLLQWMENSVQEWGATLSADAMAAVGRWLKGLPLFLLTVMFTLMTSLLIAWDYQRITEFLARQIPQRGVRLLHRVKAILTGSVLRLLRAYGLLFLLTLAELSLGLWLLGVEEFFVAALAIAAVDLLPVVGSGLVLGSWSAIALAGGRTALGVGLLALWGVISLVRGFLEPKIVGDQIGLHPLVTLTAMYFGLRTAGVAGMLALPLLCLVAVRLQADGSLRFYR